MRQNLIVILLPLAVMLGLFSVGFYIINQSSAVTNEDLVNHIQMELDIQLEEGVGYQVDVVWSWNDFPNDGLMGDDFIEIVLLNDSMEPIKVADSIGSLYLKQGNDIIFETSHIVVSDEGIAFQFPNKSEDNLLFGPKGEVNVNFPLQEEAIAYIEVKYYHTWKEWDSQLKAYEALENQLQMHVIEDYWIASRSASIR
ncbi:MAG: hypothetical protein LRY73_01820 [Bacillus sp. (in: Bacteria)]|nr:hypothetical protein [Bacillus sp. (in: firmicutes)]